MGRAPCCDKANVKKGPWSPEEDNKLKEFIDKYGTCGNWIALPHKAGLKRCGKSCRLRWLNYLRPNIKHGEFTDEEDTIICTLFTTIGSRWSIIAAQLPGRTDNDIKNYWNTKLKKKLMGISPSQRKPYHHHHQLMFSSPSSSLQGDFITTAQTPLPPLTHHQDFFTPPTPTPTPHYHIFEGYQQISYTDQMVGFESNTYNGLWGKPPLECGYEDIKQMIGSNSEVIDGLFVDDTSASSARGSKIQGRSVYNL